MRSRRLELPRALAHNDLNVARLPVPPRPHTVSSVGLTCLLGRSAPVAKRLTPRKHCEAAPRFSFQRVILRADWLAGLPADFGVFGALGHIGHSFVDGHTFTWRQSILRRDNLPIVDRRIGDPIGRFSQAGFEIRHGDRVSASKLQSSENRVALFWRPIFWLPDVLDLAAPRPLSAH